MFVNPPRDQAAQGYGLVDLLAGSGLDDRTVDDTEEVHCDGGVDRAAAGEVPRAAGLQRKINNGRVGQLKGKTNVELYPYSQTDIV